MAKRKSQRSGAAWAVEMEVFRHLLESVAEEVGVILRTTALSANIRERLDFSAAVIDGQGRMAAQASHIPVHLGSCHLTAQEILRSVDLEPGDVVLLNDPFQGGTHLPDITLFAPFFGDDGEIAFGVLTRAHHSDVGGGVPGSMGNFDEIYKEGIIIPPVRVVRRGNLDHDIVNFFLANVRTPDERRGDLMAQIAATSKGVQRIADLVGRYTLSRLIAAADGLIERSSHQMRAEISRIPDGIYCAEDVLDSPGEHVIRVRVCVRGETLIVDFEGTDPHMDGSLNAHEAITTSVVFYVMRSLAREAIPTNSGCLSPVEIVIPPDTLVGAQRPRAVAGGNVETSQRIVDVLLRALAEALPDRIPADSQGTMNNLSFGGQRDDGTRFTYFETLAGGAGAGPDRQGASGIHTHMTNTLNTPIEVLEATFPVRVSAYHLRAGSGGAGERSGGDGVVREIEALTNLEVSLLTTRRESAPAGLAGGASALPGRNRLKSKGRWRDLPSSGSFPMSKGDRLRIETPGGGGYSPQS